MMDIRRITLFAALILIVYTLWNAWQKDYPVVKSGLDLATAHQHIPTPSSSNNTLTLEAKHPDKGEKAQSLPVLPASLIHVNTDVLHLVIDARGGDIVKAELTQYPVSVDEKQKPFVILDKSSDKRSFSRSSLLTNLDQKSRELDVLYRSAAQAYKLPVNQDTLTVVLEGQDSSGLEIRKIFRFTRGSYVVGLNYSLTNKGDKHWLGYMNTQLSRTAPEEKSSMFQVSAYTGASYGNPGYTKYQKVSFREMAKSSLLKDVTGGWVAMQEHYFLTAFIPPAASKNLFYTRALDNIFSIGAVTQEIKVAPGQKQTVGTQLYIGPEDTNVLAKLAPGLEMTVDYGFFWFVSAPLLKIMAMIYSIVGNWGWTIVLVTLLIKALFFRLSARSYKSMAGMRKLQPKLAALKERYGDDKAKLSQATMELYKQEKVNPLGGCLPILVQIPVFIGLYWVLLESVELRQAPFIFWIRDLSVMDPFHILPLIMGGTMLIQQRLNPAPPDPVQAKMMMFLPLVFTALFWSFPSGLVLYWIVNNTLSILQQWYITAKYGTADPKPQKAVAVK